MSKFRFYQGIISIFFLSIFLYGCASSTIIQSIPTGAKLYVDGESVGQTPYKLKDSKITGATTYIKLEMEGYENKITSISKDEEVNVGAVVGGLFFVVPFLWTMEYKPFHTYELKKETINESQINQNDSDLVNKIQSLKKLNEDGTITNEEFEKAKSRLLNH